MRQDSETGLGPFSDLVRAVGKRYVCMFEVECLHVRAFRFHFQSIKLHHSEGQRWQWSDTYMSVKIL